MRAGTGKTENIRALGMLLGRPLVVANCSADMSETSMATMIRGCSASGVWLICDQFHLLTEMSSRQFFACAGNIREALQAGSPTVTFTGTRQVSVKIHPDACLFATEGKPLWLIDTNPPANGLMRRIMMSVRSNVV
jgi:dynein heavy chain 1